MSNDTQIHTHSHNNNQTYLFFNIHTNKYASKTQHSPHDNTLNMKLAILALLAACSVVQVRAIPRPGTPMGLSKKCDACKAKCTDPYWFKCIATCERMVCEPDLHPPTKVKKQSPRCEACKAKCSDPYWFKCIRICEMMSCGPDFDIDDDDLDDTEEYLYDGALLNNMRDDDLPSWNLPSQRRLRSCESNIQNYLTHCLNAAKHSYGCSSPQCKKCEKSKYCIVNCAQLCSQQKARCYGKANAMSC